jgi:hypothetical protein
MIYLSISANLEEIDFGSFNFIFWSGIRFCFRFPSETISAITPVLCTKLTLGPIWPLEINLEDRIQYWLNF